MLRRLRYLRVVVLRVRLTVEGQAEHHDTEVDGIAGQISPAPGTVFAEEVRIGGERTIARLTFAPLLPPPALLHKLNEILILQRLEFLPHRLRNRQREEPRHIAAHSFRAHKQSVLHGVEDCA